ncbi:MAG: hypothetical protein AAF561_05750, partial [Planctomycetota bacterium]
RVGKANAKFDYKKLTNFNTEAVAEAGEDRRLAGLKDYIEANPNNHLEGVSDDDLLRLLRMCEGFHVFAEVDVKTRLFRDAPTDYDDKAVEKHLKKGDPSGVEHLTALRQRLANLDDWSVASLESTIKQLCEERGAGLGKVAQPARVAIAGGPVSPPIFDTLSFLGKDETLARIDRCLATVG